MHLETPHQTWEYQLLTWAHEALNSAITGALVEADERTLRASYRYCAELTRLHSKTFYLASGLLPAEKRRAVRALYAFCRITDNIVDENQGEDLQAVLDDWARRISLPRPPANDPVAMAWADAQARFNIPSGYARQLINGVARDLRQRCYATFADLAEYAYGVASTVGLMAMHIIGFDGAQAIPYAIKLGVALQLTNILRDVAEDWGAGRLYLPQDELAAFGLCENDIAHGRAGRRWQEFMAFQIARNRRLYSESRAGIAMLVPDGRLAIQAAADLYQAILRDIERHDYNVFRRRAHITVATKLRMLPGIWWRARQGQNGARRRES